jgi:hypothetical protein
MKCCINHTSLTETVPGEDPILQQAKSRLSENTTAKLNT